MADRWCMELVSGPCRMPLGRCVCCRCGGGISRDRSEVLCRVVVHSSFGLTRGQGSEAGTTERDGVKACMRGVASVAQCRLVLRVL